MESLKGILLPKARIGLAAEFLDIMEPTTEADSNGLLLLFLQFTGMVAGSKVILRVGSKSHKANIFSFIVGDSSLGRKGTVLAAVKDFFKLVDESFVKKSLRPGLSTQEGIIQALIKDSRPLLGVETEASTVFKNFDRQGNKLSECIRNAYDGDPMGNMSIANKAYIEDHFIGLTFLITQSELSELITKTSLTNGFANRFIWLHVSRSKLLSFPPEPDQERLQSLVKKMSVLLAKLKDGKQITLAKSACGVWDRMYVTLNSRDSETNIEIKNRAVNNILRVALIYAILDESSEVEERHLEAAYELIRHSESCVDKIFSKKSSTKDEMKLLKALNARGGWTSQTEVIEQIFNRNRSAEEIGRLQKELTEKKLIESSTAAKGLVLTKLWRLTPQGEELANGSV